LRDKLDFFRACGAIKPGVEDFFQASSWQMVLTGMNVLPEQYNPTVDALDSNKLVLSLAAGQKAIAQIAEQQPLHDDFINEYCAAPLL
jgi:tryptophan halogenase